MTDERCGDSFRHSRNLRVPPAYSENRPAWRRSRDSAKWRFQGMVSPDETVALVVTGNGLKDIPSAQKAVEIAAGGGSGHR